MKSRVIAECEDLLFKPDPQRPQLQAAEMTDFDPNEQKRAYKETLYKNHAKYEDNKIRSGYLQN